MIPEWLLSTAVSTAVSTGLLGFAAFIGRSQLSHWLNKELEAEKARHQKDLEAYKVSLISESERTRALQEVRKSIALMVAEKKFDVLNRLHAAAENIASDALVLLSAQAPSRSRDDIEKIERRVVEYRQALRNASLFSVPEEMESFYLLHNRLQGTIAFAKHLEIRARDKEVEAQEQALLPVQKNVNEILHRKLHAMLAMEE